MRKKPFIVKWQVLSVSNTPVILTDCFATEIAQQKFVEKLNRNPTVIPNSIEKLKKE